MEVDVGAVAFGFLMSVYDSELHCWVYSLSHPSMLISFKSPPKYLA